MVIPSYMLLYVEIVCIKDAALILKISLCNTLTNFVTKEI